MKKLLILLFSLFFLISPSVFADDISDFEIEGISTGDSLLDYMTEEEILEGIEMTKDHYYYLNEPNKYAEAYLFKYFPTYSGGLSFYFKNNSTNQYVTDKNEKYTILALRGLITYIEDFDSCIQKRDEIAEILSEMFSNAEITESIFTYGEGSFDESDIDAIVFMFASGSAIEAQCNNWNETYRIQNNFTEGLSVVIMSKEIASWMTDY